MSNRVKITTPEGDFIYVNCNWGNVADLLIMLINSMTEAEAKHA